jgi:hypothetical protein
VTGEAELSPEKQPALEVAQVWLISITPSAASAPPAASCATAQQTAHLDIGSSPPR